MATTWLTIQEAAELFNRHTVTLYKLAGKLAKEGSPHTKTEGSQRFISREYLAEHTAPKRRRPLQQRLPMPPASATPDELHQVIRERLDDLRSALEHERAIARSLADQNAQLVEQNRRLLEQVDDLTALSLRLGMSKSAQRIDIAGE